MTKYHCVVSIDRGKVSSYISCTTKAQSAAAHLARLREQGMAGLKIVTRASKPAGVKTPPRGRTRTQGSLFSKTTPSRQGSLFGRSFRTPESVSDARSQLRRLRKTSKKPTLSELIALKPATTGVSK